MRQDVSAEVVASTRHAENYIHEVKYINLLLNVEDDIELNNCQMNSVLFDEIYTGERKINYSNFCCRPWNCRHHAYQGLCRFMDVLIAEAM